MKKRAHIADLNAQCKLLEQELAAFKNYKNKNASLVDMLQGTVTFLQEEETKASNPALQHARKVVEDYVQQTNNYVNGT